MWKTFVWRSLRDFEGEGLRELPRSSSVSLLDERGVLYKLPEHVGWDRESYVRIFIFLPVTYCSISVTHNWSFKIRIMHVYERDCSNICLILIVPGTKIRLANFGQALKPCRDDLTLLRILGDNGVGVRRRWRYASNITETGQSL